MSPFQLSGYNSYWLWSLYLTLVVCDMTLGKAERYLFVNSNPPTTLCKSAAFSWTQDTTCTTTLNIKTHCIFSRDCSYMFISLRNTAPSPKCFTAGTPQTHIMHPHKHKHLRVCVNSHRSYRWDDTFALLMRQLLWLWRKVRRLDTLHRRNVGLYPVSHYARSRKLTAVWHKQGTATLAIHKT